MSPVSVTEFRDTGEQGSVISNCVRTPGINLASANDLSIRPINEDQMPVQGQEFLIFIHLTHRGKCSSQADSELTGNQFSKEMTFLLQQL